MRQFAFLGGAAAVLFSGAVVLAAAGPTPSPSATAHPAASPTASPTPRPSTAPKASTTPAATGLTSTTEPSFNAQIQPLQISGTATITEATDATGSMTLRVTGLLDAQHWSVDVDGGTIALPNERLEIASKAGVDVTRLATDTVRIHLTKTEMAAFLKAQKGSGVVAVVSDGSRVGYAEFAAG